MKPAKDGTDRIASARESRLFRPSGRKLSPCPRHQIPERSAWEKHMRERSTIVAPSAAQVPNRKSSAGVAISPRIPQSFLDAVAPRHYPRRTFPQRPGGAVRKKLDAHPSTGPGDCHRVPAWRYRAGDALPPWPAKCHRLFFGRPQCAVVGAGVFHRRNGNLNAYDHRHARHRLRREPPPPPTPLLLPHRPSTHRFFSPPPLFFPPVFFPPPPHPQTPPPAPACPCR